MSGITGYTSSSAGLDVTAIVEQLMSSARATEKPWRDQQKALEQRSATLNDLSSATETLLDKVEALTDRGGLGAKRIATSSDPNTAYATASAGVLTGSHTLVVKNLASVASCYSSAANTSALRPGSVSIQVGTAQPKTFTVSASENQTLDALAKSINDANLGARATVVTGLNGSQLAIVSETSGSMGEITINSSSAEFTRGNRGADAQVVFDGVPLTSTTNVIEGLVPGLKVDLGRALPEQTVTIRVVEDRSALSAAIQDLVEVYNNIIKGLNTQFAFNSSTQSSGILAQDSTARTLHETLLNAASFASKVSGEITSIRSLGIEMKDDGTLTVNEATLRSAIDRNPAQVTTFFQGTGTTGGFGTKLSASLTHLTDSIDGSFKLDLDGISKQQDELERRVEDYEQLLRYREERWITEYSRIDAMLRQSSTLLQQVQTELNAFTRNK